MKLNVKRYTKEQRARDIERIKKQWENLRQTLNDWQPSKLNAVIEAMDN